MRRTHRLGAVSRVKQAGGMGSGPGPGPVRLLRCPRLQRSGGCGRGVVLLFCLGGGLKFIHLWKPKVPKQNFDLSVIDVMPAFSLPRWCLDLGFCDKLEINEAQIPSSCRAQSSVRNPLAERTGAPGNKDESQIPLLPQATFLSHFIPSLLKFLLKVTGVLSFGLPPFRQSLTPCCILFLSPFSSCSPKVTSDLFSLTQLSLLSFHLVCLLTVNFLPLASTLTLSPASAPPGIKLHYTYFSQIQHSLRLPPSFYALLSS